MSKQRPCRQCREMFTITGGGHRYCDSCRVEREAAQAALAATKRCTHCDHRGADVKHGICPTCKAAQRAVEHAEVERIRQKKLARYGACTQCDRPQDYRSDGLCPTCRAQANAARIRQQRRAAHETKRQARQDNDDFFVWLEGLPDNEFYEAYNALRHAVAELGVTMHPLHARRNKAEANPEEQPHDDQAAIDVTFNDLMKGLDL